MVGPSGLEPPTSRLSGVRSNHLSYEPIYMWFCRLLSFRTLLFRTLVLGGDKRDRTADPLLAKQVLSQLSYTPMFGFPSVFQASFCRHSFSLSILKIEQCFLSTCSPLLTEAFELSFVLLRKEVIQPHLPIRLPCYDFTPVINPTLDGVLPKVRRPALGVTDSHGVTGGVYKARERIHRSMLICDY